MPPPFAITLEACAHCWDESAVVSPHHQAAVHKEECAYCCRTCRHSGGVLVCMCCHAAFCAAHVAKHVSLRTNHAMYVWLRECPQKEVDAPRDVNKLGAVLPKEYETAVCCAICSVTFASSPELVEGCYQSILNASSTGAKAAINANEEEFTRPQCPHLACLEQEINPFQTAPNDTETCVVVGCGCQENNWMCMTCGAIGCPRFEAGGNGHALEHYNITQHPVVVKLGTVTPSGADFYCYSCDDEVSDARFDTHMKHFGIDVKTSKKTAKTLGEIQYDYWSQFDFNRITESGETLVPVFGPGRTGMRNFGNACYMNCVLQCLMSLPAFKEAFYSGCETRHQAACREVPYNCRSCQVERVASGLLSGEFSIPDNEEPNGITAREFKQVFARGHPEFSTSEQQDAQEYLLYLLEQMRRYVKPSCVNAKPNWHPADIFRMKMENRVECTSCRRVRYTYESDFCLSLPIPLDAAEGQPADDRKLMEKELEASRPRTSLKACIESLMMTVEVDCSCSACGNSVTYSKTVRVATFPDVLTVYLRRAHFDVETMTVTKRDVFVDVPEEVDLGYLRGKGIQPGEVEMPSAGQELQHKPVSTAATPVDEMALATLLSMGVDEKVAKYSLLRTDMNVERALDYVFSRENIEQEIALADDCEEQAEVRASGTTSEVDGPSRYLLHAMISHMGASAKTGHYVCHIRDEETGKWLLFNDEKVAESKQPPFSLASLYFYKRKNVYD